MTLRTLLTTVLALLFSTTALADLANLPEKATTDHSEYRHLVLDNGLRVILLSDPDLNKSSAGIAVGAGSYNDPEDRPGLAHFLEHMLFLGTEKYPDEAEYSNYLRSNGGYSNAYTAGDHTDYHFEVNHQAFEGALDRFSQFFIAPLFDAEFTEREMNAVDSEFEMNLQNDGWRQQEIFRTMVRPDHPEHHFAIGNLETLKGISRADFMAFYDRYYSANLMALALTSNAPLDEMEGWARKYFSAIKNKQRPPVDYSADLVDTSRPPGLVLVEPVQDKRLLSMAFPVPGTRALYRSKPDELIGFLLGYEGEGSLLSLLKAQGLATSLSGGAYQATKDYSLFSIDIGLTPAGAEDWQRVLEATFAYIALLRDSAYPEYLFQERATMARLDELYQDKGEGAARAVTLSRDALQFPLEDAARVAYIWEESSPELYFEMLRALRPDNMIATLEAKGVPTDRQEKHFGVRYSLQPFSAELLAGLERPAPVAGLTLPRPNPFIPSSVGLLAQRPAKVIDRPGLVLYYAQDTTFERPQVGYRIRIRQPQQMAGLRPAVMRDFYVAVVKEMLNEQLYDAAAAGLALDIADTAEGVVIAVSGYNQSAQALLDEVVSRLREPDLDAARFAALKERKLRELENASFADAFMQARELQRTMLRERYYPGADRLPAAREVTLDDVRDFARRMFGAGDVEMVAYGNVSQEEASAAAERVVAGLGLAPIPAGQAYDDRTVQLAPGQAVVGSNVLKVNNSALFQLVLLGKADAKTRAAAMVLDNFVQEPYYSEMRTRQQLGYVVGSGMTETEQDLYGLFVIQSADYDATELVKRSDTFLLSLPGLFDALPDEQFETLKAGVRSQLAEKDKSIGERTARYFNLAFERDAWWSRNEDTIAALDSLTREDVRQLLQKLDRRTGSSITALSFAEQHAAAAGKVEPSFTDIVAWKRQQSYR
jgi:insulysin